MWHRRLVLAAMVVLLGALVPLALACEEEEAPTPIPTPTPTGARLGPGAAGIPSNPRPVRGLEGILVLDNGLAIFKERPAQEDRTGVTDTSIKLGRWAGASSPLISIYESIWEPTLQALIRRVNEAGGIHGRRLELITRDDQYNPAVTVQVVRELVEKDQVFAVFMGVGNAPHQAVREYLTAKGVPDLWVFDGSTQGLEPVTTARNVFPGIVADMLEGIVTAEAIMAEHPRGRVAVIYQHDPLGAEYIQAFRSIVKARGGTIVAEIGFDVTATDMTPFVRQALATNPDALAFYGTFTTALSTVRAVKELGANVPIYQRGALPDRGDMGKLLDGVAHSGQAKTLLSHPDDKTLLALKAIAQEEGIPFHDILTGIAYRSFEHLVRALLLAGPDLTRQGLIEAIELGFDGSWTCSLCLGPTILSPYDHWSFEYSDYRRWDHDTLRWEQILPITSFETSQGRGIRGNVEGYECRPAQCPWRE